MKETAETVVGYLLDAMFNTEGRGKTISFMFGEDSDPWSDKRFGTELYFDEYILLDATLFLRSNGPFYLRQMSPDEIRSLLLDFVSSNFMIMFDDAFFQFFDHSFSEQLSSETKEKIILAFLSSNILNPNKSLMLFPLTSISISEDFMSELFFIVDNEGLTSVLDNEGVDETSIKKLLPDEVNNSHSRYWLGVWAPSFQAADSIKRTVLGAASLTMHYNNRYVTLMAASEGWCCTITDSTIEYRQALIAPTLMYPLTLTKSDREWLDILVSLLQEPSKKAVRQTRALDYFYNTWHRNESERYPMLYMSLESVLGDSSRATAAVVDGVISLISSNVPKPRVRALSDLRAAVVHGGAAQVYDSSKYSKYYKKYRQDPIRDLGLITAECLRVSIFDGTMNEKEDSNAKYIQEAIKTGNMPDFKGKNILEY